MKAEEVLEMELRLQQEGLCLEIPSDSERLDRLWGLYVEKENSVRMLTQELQELRDKHAAEIETVQVYIQNIRSLSKTRDSVALELEQENEVLCSNMMELNLQQETEKSEIAEMLVQEGLDEVMTSSLSELVAYLLADRGALMEKIQALEEENSKNLDVQCTQKRRTHENEGKDNHQTSEDKRCEDRQLSLLERDLDEAATRLNLAHKEIRRLTDELESAHLTKIAYDAELHGAQVDAEQLRHEVEKLKHCDLAEVQAMKEKNEVLDAELRHLRNNVHTMREQVLQLIDRNIKALDSEDEDFIYALTQELTLPGHTHSLPKGKNKKRKDGNKRCPEKLEEGLSSLQELNHVVMKLQVELEQEKALRKKVEEECDDEKRKRKKAEQLTLELQEKVHDAKVQQLQENVCVSHSKAETFSSPQNTQDFLKTMLQEQENLKLRQDFEKLGEFCEKLQTEIQQVHCNLHSYIRKYDELKVRHREKLAEAKQVYLQEMTRRDQKIKAQERELDILTKRFKKESDMVKMVSSENNALLLTKTTLLCQLTEAEEQRKNATAKICALQRRVDFLEQDSMQQWEKNMEKSTQISKLQRRLWDLESLISTRYLKKHHRSDVKCTEDTSFSERRFETSIIQKTKDGCVEKPGDSASPSGASDIQGYMNIFTHNLR
ncbi:hypothetical protein KOW79_017296 [Hemibagrus wyckioides]|uniref:Uncharacterized protein n=1 Tax=Hemibagrus wyckioides TaxID=337641 RepID=A0A9D3NAV3_9TELE|nr:hypothetical protein KOW79_017296 [Hemibagrus wyckioides]